MEQAALLLEVGSQAIADLTSEELQAILEKYTNAQVGLAGMATFNLLRKKFQSNYRMGRMYEELSQKYQFYDKMYKEYASKSAAGRLGKSDFSDQVVTDPDKFSNASDKL